MYMKGKSDLLYKISAWIVDKRKLVFLMVIAGVIFSLFSIGWIEVESDLTSFLPDKSPSREGVEIMNQEFVMPGTAQIMVANVTLEDAHRIYDEIVATRGVQLVEFDETAAHYNNLSAYYSIIFKGAASSEEAAEALALLKENLADYDTYFSSDVGNPMEAMLDKEIVLIMGVAAVIILLMLLLTSKTVIEVPVILLTFLVAMVLNMGTNFIFGKISFVSNSVTSMLQLALSLDYAVIMINRYKEESKYLSQRDAAVAALHSSIPEVAGSSMTTIGGMAAMLFMQFKLGPDMAICLIKAIFFAMLSVFVFMPGLLMLFGNVMKKTEHKSLIPDVSFIGKFAYASRKIVVPIFALLVVAAIILSSNCPFAYGYTSQEAAKLNEQTLAQKLISENFGSTNMLALVVPSGDYDKEKELLAELETFDEVSSTMGLANVEAIDGYTLADKLTPRQFSELAGLDYELAALVYAAYAAEQEKIGVIINDLDSYGVPLIDMFLFVIEQIDSGLVSLDGEQGAMLTEGKEMIMSAKSQMVGENYNRMVLYIDMPEDSEETFECLERIRTTAEKYYGEDNIYLIGNSTTAEDFKNAFKLDNIVVAAVSIIIVLLVLLFSFKSLAMPVILILVIQGAIWINFSIPSLLGTPLFFLGYQIISAIQMGANIDYAIVIATRYNELKREMPKRDAIIKTMNFAFPTVITSGAILAVTGLLIGYLSSEATISSLGINLGRGTIISVILVLFVLPQLLLVSDGLVDKTTFKLSLWEKNEKKASGATRVCGRVKGEINGTVNGVIDAVIDGNVNLTLLSGDANEEKEGADNEKE